MQRTERVGERKPDQTLIHEQSTAPGELGLQRLRNVMRRIDPCPRHVIIGEFHHVIEEVARLIAPDVQDIDETRVTSRDRLELRHALELALKRLFALKRPPVHDLHRAPGPGHTARQPDLAIGAAPDDPHHFVVRHVRRNAIGRHERHCGENSPLSKALKSQPASQAGH